MTHKPSLRKWDGTYPVRARIVDVTGEVWHGLEIATPDESKPHIGKEGLAELDEDGDVRITLDDGSIIYGFECWWDAVLP